MDARLLETFYRIRVVASAWAAAVLAMPASQTHPAAAEALATTHSKRGWTDRSWALVSLIGVPVPNTPGPTTPS